MSLHLDLRLSPPEAANLETVHQLALEIAQVSKKEYPRVEILRRSYDARQKYVKVQLRVALLETEEDSELTLEPLSYQHVEEASEVHIIGAGPAGLFAALTCLEEGLKPVIWERGKDVRARRRDLAALHKEHIVDPNSNYCFGEGGAGTYSDGKLYTRAKKRGVIKRVLEVLVHHGAEKDILVNVHPHIGTNRLPAIITSMRETILEHGGEIHFESQVTDIQIEDGKIAGLSLADGKAVKCDKLILATGHSARDIFHLLQDKGVFIEFKPFALGARIEHPQSVIDTAQYHSPERGEFLPPASYKLVHQVEGRGVYSFCMCPGGIIAPCATSPGEIVTNGWSPSKRNNPYANSGIVTEVHWDDITAFHEHGALAGVMFQQAVEQACWKAGGESQVAPAQRMHDFIQGKPSTDLPVNSYQPGTVPARLDLLLPGFVVKSLKEALTTFCKKMKGYDHPDAVLVAPESRTSSPVRIPRHPMTMVHPEVAGLYPSGEGAGYAGGIVSAALDGIRVVHAIKETV